MIIYYTHAERKAMKNIAYKVSPSLLTRMKTYLQNSRGLQSVRKTTMYRNSYKSAKV